ncbi:Uncharacterized protein ToN1_25110 [Aromatoleum petrolei]|nr:Uncharacterized protein ToN1_25110 [Aromatoleum petrolei]
MRCARAARRKILPSCPADAVECSAAMTPECRNRVMTGHVSPGG